MTYLVIGLQVYISWDVLMRCIIISVLFFLVFNVFPMDCNLDDIGSNLSDNESSSTEKYYIAMEKENGFDEKVESNCCKNSCIITSLIISSGVLFFSTIVMPVMHELAETMEAMGKGDGGRLLSP